MSRSIVEKITEVFQPQAPLWGCEFTPRHIILAGVTKNRRRITTKQVSALQPGAVVGSLTEKNIQSPDTVRSALTEMLNHIGFKGAEIVAVVPDDATRIAFLTAEKLSKDPQEQQTFIRWKLKKNVPFDVDTAQLAFRVLGPHAAGAGVDLLVALSPRSVIEEYENVFDSFNIQAGLVLPSTLAALNLFNAPPKDTLFLKIAADCMTTTIFQNRRIQFYRRVANVSVYDAVYPTVMYYQDKLGGKALEQLTICGYDSDIRSSADELEQKLGLRAQRLEPKIIDDIFKPVLGSVHLSDSEGMV